MSDTKHKVFHSPAVVGLGFDVDGTLYSRSAFWLRMIPHLLLFLLRRRISIGDIKVLYHFQKVLENARRNEKLTSTTPWLIEQVAIKTGRPADEVEEVFTIWVDNICPEVLGHLRQHDMRWAMTHLKLRGFKLGVYSDYPAQSKLAALGLPVSMFEAVIVSTSPQTAALKPRTTGFNQLVEAMAVSPAQTCFYGDREETDGSGARATGMDFVHCKPAVLPRRKISLSRHLRIALDTFGARESVQPCRSEAGCCWVCGSDEAVLFKADTLPPLDDPSIVNISDRSYGHTTTLLRCENCGFIRADEQDLDAIQRLYKDVVDDDYQSSIEARRVVFAELVKTVKAHNPEAATLLDIGSGTGGLCLEARSAGLEAEGIEPSTWAVQIAREQGLIVSEGYFPAHIDPQRRFDVITICDVIEHVSDPIGLLKSAHNHLNVGGLLIVVTPDIGSFAARVTGSKWWHFRPGHIGYFKKDTMVSSLAIAGFEVAKVHNHVWRFPLWYLIERVFSYIPLKFIFGWFFTARHLKKIREMIIPLDLKDSKVFVARRKEKL